MPPNPILILTPSRTADRKKKEGGGGNQMAYALISAYIALYAFICAYIGLWWVIGLGESVLIRWYIESKKPEQKASDRKYRRCKEGKPGTTQASSGVPPGVSLLSSRSRVLSLENVDARLVDIESGLVLVRHLFYARPLVARRLRSRW